MLNLSKTFISRPMKWFMLIYFIGVKIVHSIIVRYSKALDMISIVKYLQKAHLWVVQEVFDMFQIDELSSLLSLFAQFYRPLGNREPVGASVAIE
jgi:hypothetical protein